MNTSMTPLAQYLELRTMINLRFYSLKKAGFDPWTVSLEKVPAILSGFIVGDGTWEEDLNWALEATAGVMRLYGVRLIRKEEWIEMLQEERVQLEALLDNLSMPLFV